MMIHETVKGVELVLETSPAIFSPGSVDRGTLAMLSQVEFDPADKVLDLGCGSGVVGILAAKLTQPGQVVLSDADPEAVRLSRSNAAANAVPGVRIILSQGFAQIPDTDFTLILSNPPYHTDFSVAKEFIEHGFGHLAPGGRMLMVTKRLEWYRNKLRAIFGNVSVREIDGYYVFLAYKKLTGTGRRQKQKPQLSKKLQRREALKKRPKKRQPEQIRHAGTGESGPVG